MAAPMTEEPAPVSAALRYCDMILSRIISSGAVTLAGIPSSPRPNVCDVATREAYCRCDQCWRATNRLYFYRGRRVLCARCARSRIHAGVVLARPVPWFLAARRAPT